MNIQRDIFPTKAATKSSKPQYALPTIDQRASQKTTSTFTAGTDFTIPAGAAGTEVQINMPNAPVLGNYGRTGAFGNTSFSFGGAAATTFTTEVAFIADINNLGGEAATLANGRYMIDYETGIVYGKKADSGTTGTCTYTFLAGVTEEGSGDVTAAANLTNNAVVVGDGGVKGVKTLAALGASGTVLTSNGAGVPPSFQTISGGDVVGPASSTDNAVALFDLATGKLLQNSTVIVDPATGDTTGQRDITASRNILAQDELRSGIAGTAAGVLRLYPSDDALGASSLTPASGGPVANDWTLPIAGVGEGTVVGTGVTQTLTNKTLNSPVLNSPTIGLTATLAPIPSVDLTGSGFSGPVTVDTNGVGIGAGLFMAADGHYDEADADAAASMPCTAIALETGTGAKTVLFSGFIRNDAWNWTPGGVLYVSNTQGTFTQTAPVGTGDVVQVIGKAESSDVIHFCPSLSMVVVV